MSKYQGPGTPHPPPTPPLCCTSPASTWTWENGDYNRCCTNSTWSTGGPTLGGVQKSIPRPPKTYKKMITFSFQCYKPHERLPANLASQLVKGSQDHMVNFLIFVHKNVYRIGFQEIKIRPLKGFEKRAFFSLFLMRKRLSSGQKWFLRPYFPLIRGMFLLKSGLWFSFRALPVPKTKIEDHF